MKQTLYSLILLASVGTVGLVATNPKLVQQGASLLGLSQSEKDSASPSSYGEEDHLARFLRQYPDNPHSAKKNPDEMPLAAPPVPERLAPPITAAPPIVPLVKTPILESQSAPKAPPVASAAPPISQPTPEIKPPPKDIPIAVAPAPQPVPEQKPAFPPVSPTPTPHDTPVSATSTPNDTPRVDPFAAQASGMASTVKKTEPPETGFARSSQVPSNDYRATSLMTPSPRSAETEPPVSWPTDSAKPQEHYLNPPVAVPVGGGILAYQDQSKPSPNTGTTGPGSSNDVPGSPSDGLGSLIAEPRAESQLLLSPSIMVEEVPCHGTEMVARVGTQVILMCDILPQLRRAGNRMIAEQMKNVPADQQAAIPEEEKEDFVRQVITANYSSLLQEQIMLMLVLNDFKASKKKEEIEFFEKKMGEDFDQNDVPKMMKEFNVKNMGELKQYLKHELGSSLERERMLNVHAKIAQQWMMFSVKEAEGECTYDEMLEYYTKNRAAFEKNAKVRWKELAALFDKHGGEQKTWEKIAWMGNQVAGGAPFDQIAKENSDGFTASKGGLWDWTQIGSLTSQDIEKAIFTMPPNTLSPIIKGPKGFHIVLVVEREEASVVPLLDAQVTIREKIKMQRRQRYQEEFFADLKRKYPVKILRETIDFKPTRRAVAATPSN